jgi:glycosyltransferase involved in cell wall biosynthesis
MKVLFLASYFPKPDNPVMGTWALSQAQALVRQGIDLQVISFTSWVPKAIALTSGAKAYAYCPEEYTWSGNVKVKYPRWLYYQVPPIKQKAYINPEPYLKLAFWSAQNTLIKEIQTFQPDIIFCHHSLPNGWMVTQLPKKYQRSLFILEHDYDEISDCYSLPKRRHAFAQVANHATGLMAVSQRMELDMRSLFPQATIFTHHNGVELIPFQLENTPRPLEIANKTIILACAIFAKRKGIPLLIEAFDKIAIRYPNAILRVIGAGPEEERVQKTVAKLNLKDRIQLLGKQNHHCVLQEMVWADCFALVGWDEPFATVYLEAMAAEKAIICCNDGGINDVIQNGVHGLTVPPKDIEATAKALEQMLENPKQRQTMGKAAKNLIERSLTWDAKAKELIYLFEETLAQSSPSRSIQPYEHI